MKKNFLLHRRKFISTATLAASGMLMSRSFGNTSTQKNLTPVTVGEVMDLFTKEIPNAPFSTTVDTLKSGDRSIVVTGIVTTMFATIAVIKKAIELKANFIIAHEPTFYNHQDQTEWLEGDDVFEFKAALLKQHKIAVWRNHDYVHRLSVDGVRKQVVEQLGWEKFGDPRQPVFIAKPSYQLKDLISHVKKQLGISSVRYIGDAGQRCEKILLMPGAAGGMPQIRNIRQFKPDVLVCGEVAEWETAEYVRDARASGKSLALIVLGHVASEEPGSLFMARWYQQKLPQMPVTHVLAGESLVFG